MRAEIDLEVVGLEARCLRCHLGGIVEDRLGEFVHLVEIVDEVRHRRHVESRSAEVDRRRRDVEVVQPEQLGQGPRYLIHDLDRPALVRLQSVDDIDLALELGLLDLVFLDLFDDLLELFDFFLGRLDFLGLLVELALDPQHPAAACEQAEDDAGHHQNIAEFSRSAATTATERRLRLARDDGAFALGEEIDLDHLD